MRRFFLNAPISNSMEITGNDAHHIIRVLRMKLGDTITIVGRGGETGIAQIQTLAADTVGLTLETLVTENKEPPVDVCLAQALPKTDKMDYIIQKAVELGVAHIIPMITEHCVVKYDDKKKNDRCQRWQKIAVEAAKQCGRTLLPEIGDMQNFTDIIKKREAETLIVMLYEGQQLEPIKSFLTRHKQYHKVLLLIGPEGGFSKEEVDLCKANDIATISMGPRILRTETASLAALTAVMYEYGGLGG